MRRLGGAPRSSVAAALGMGSAGALAWQHRPAGTTACASPSIKVYYGDFTFWRAECVRMILFIGGVPFDDVRDVKFADLKASGKLTFGAFPVMEVDGKILSQTQAMANYASKIAGFAPSDAWDAAKVDEAVNGCTDVTTDVGSTFRLPAEEKVPARQAMVKPDGRLFMHMAGLEKVVKEHSPSGFLLGKTISVADLAIWRLERWFSSGVLDGIPKDFVRANFPRITEVCDAVDAHPKVKEWKNMHSKHYSK